MSRDAVSGAVRDAVNDAVDDAVDDAIDVAVDGAVSGMVRGTVNGAVKDAVHGADRAVIGAGNWNSHPKQNEPPGADTEHSHRNFTDSSQKYGFHKRTKMREATLYTCHGEAHSNAYIDHCLECMPFWAVYPVCPSCERKVSMFRARRVNTAGDQTTTKYGRCLNKACDAYRKCLALPRVCL